MTINPVSRTPDYSTFNHNGAQYVRLDKTNPETGEQASLIFRPDQLSPTQHVQYIDFMCEKAEVDLQEIREGAEEIKNDIEEIKNERNEILAERNEILAERNELKKRFIKIFKEKKKLDDAINSYIYGTPNVNSANGQKKDAQEGFFAPVLNVCSSMVDGIKSFFS